MTQQSMPPPPVPFSRLSRPRSRGFGPDVHVPLAWPSAGQADHSVSPANSTHFRSTHGASSAPPAGAAAVGYSPQHSVYQANSRYWAAKAHARHPPPPAETYSLDISAVYESSANKRNTRLNTFRCIHEGLKGIDARSTPQQLSSIALVPLIKAYCPEFPWREAELMVRDKRWLNLTTQSATTAHFYNECLVDGKKGAKKFKSGKQFFLYVVVSEKQWDEVELFQENLKATAVTSGRSSQGRRTVVSRCLPSTSASSLMPPSSVTPSTAPSTFATHPARERTGTIFADLSDSDSPSPETTSAALPVLPVAASTDHISSVVPTSLKRSHHRRDSSISESSGVARSPPSKKSAGAAIFTSPDCNHLKHALQSGGRADINVKSVLRYRVEQVDLYLPI
ncbi:hypothetical protein JVT61DRAFT_11952 [Boletus reticuloceps]|uniref:Uncharacterized protein n=1 Tax=Boletus reticuloceps TaxID=495285 RepID=A0A8I3ABQ9_9AGAM|nr:hypothetical protein JVT61DRAFT_11952 [Boletus reticuloceps]